MYKEFKNGTSISCWQEYSQFIKVKNFNWCDFHVIQFSFEFDNHCGDLEFMFIIFGLGFCIRFPYETKKSKEFKKEIKESISNLKDSCQGWTTEENYNKFKKKKSSMLPVYFKKKYVPVDKKSKYKKLFIQ